MPQRDNLPSLTGSRIRARRVHLGQKQAELAQQVGISASYLNLIEHNRRRIGGKLLLDIAQALGTDAGQLAEGTERVLLDRLRTAAAGTSSDVDLGQAEDFAGRFPSWAGLVGAQAERIEQLERALTTLSDRVTHDPFLSASLHEMVSTVTAIQSTASILAGSDPVEPVWQERFHKNILEEAVRLADASQALVGFLDTPQAETQQSTTPQEEVEAFLEAHSYRLPDVTFEGSKAACALFARYAQRYQADQEALPEALLRSQYAAVGPDPLQIALGTGVPLDCVMRRMAQTGPEGREVGLVEADSSGTLTFRRPLAAFPLPRYGASCPLWPLFSALSAPQVPLARAVRSMSGQGEPVMAYAVALPKTAPRYGEVPLMQATMLLVTLPDTPNQVHEVGLSCRVCPRTNCEARREPALLADGF